MLKYFIYAFAFSILVIVGVSIPVWLHTGSISAVIYTVLFLVASAVWGWVVAGIDYRFEKRNRK